MRNRIVAVVALLLAPVAGEGVTVDHYLPFAYGQVFQCWQGNRQKPSHHDKWNSYAYDFSPMPVGTPVVASADGVVTWVKEDTLGPTGNYKDNNGIALRHVDGNVSLYLHLQHNGALVEVGQDVLQGDVVGYSGNSGNSTKPHLHWDLRQASYRGLSVASRFKDFGGVPKKGDTCTSGNMAVRHMTEFVLIRESLDLYALCRAVGCLEALNARLQIVAKVNSKYDVAALRKAVRQRDAMFESHEAAAKATLERIRAEKSLKEAVRIATFAYVDFANTGVERDLKKRL